MDINVKHIARLARLSLTDAEKEKFAKELAAILTFAEKLKEVDVKNVEPTAGASGQQNVTRPDEAVRPASQTRQQILANAPKKEKDFIRVKAVFE